MATTLDRRSSDRLSRLLAVDGPDDLLMDMAADEIANLRQALADILDLELLPKKGAAPLSTSGGIAYRALRRESP